METGEKERREITYKDIEKAFREEAGSLLADDTIEMILDGEKKKFLIADALGILPGCFVGNQIGRYTKGLLRHAQPLSFLYEFLGFMMELSMMVFVYLLLYGAVMTAADGRYRFFSKREFLYAAVIVCCILWFGRIRRLRMGNFLRKQGEVFFATGEDETSGARSFLPEDEKKNLRKKAGCLGVLPAVFLLSLCAFLCFIIWKSGLSAGVKTDFVTVFFVYVAFAVLAGLHNVLYGSFFLPYCTIGGKILMRRPAEEIEKAATGYKALCYERMLNYRGKTMEDFWTDEVPAEELMQKLRGRMAVYRGGTLLGLLIPLVLAGVCVVQMILLGFHVTVGLCVFTFCSFLGAMLFLLAFLSANRVLKTLPKKKRPPEGLL